MIHSVTFQQAHWRHSWVILQMEGSCFEIQTACDAFQLGKWKLWPLISPWVLILPEPN